MDYRRNKGNQFQKVEKDNPSKAVQSYHKLRIRIVIVNVNPIVHHPNVVSLVLLKDNLGYSSLSGFIQSPQQHQTNKVGVSYIQTSLFILVLALTVFFSLLFCLSFIYPIFLRL